MTSFFGDFRVWVMVRLFSREIMDFVEADERIMVVMGKDGKCQQDKACKVEWQYDRQFFPHLNICVNQQIRVPSFPPMPDWLRWAHCVRRIHASTSVHPVRGDVSLTGRGKR